MTGLDWTRNAVILGFQEISDCEAHRKHTRVMCFILDLMEEP